MLSRLQLERIDPADEARKLGRQGVLELRLQALVLFQSLGDHHELGEEVVRCIVDLVSRLACHWWMAPARGCYVLLRGAGLMGLDVPRSASQALSV